MSNTEVIEKLNVYIKLYTDEYTDKWFIENKEDVEEALKNMEDGEPLVDSEYIKDNLFIDRYINDLFNDWENTRKGYNFFKFTTKKSVVNLLNYTFTITDFILLWQQYCEYNSDEGVEEMKDEEHTWNCIAYWAFRTTNQEDEEQYQISSFIKNCIKYKYTRPEGSLSCGVCLENKTLYTGCYQCNGNFVCLDCYNQLENTCPFCRCSEMIKDDLEIPKQQKWFLKTHQIRADIKRLK
jgi:hypothetical protein